MKKTKGLVIRKKKICLKKERETIKEKLAKGKTLLIIVTNSIIFLSKNKVPVKNQQEKDVIEKSDDEFFIKRRNKRKIFARN